MVGWKDGCMGSAQVAATGWLAVGRARPEKLGHTLKERRGERHSKTFMTDLQKFEAPCCRAV
eukprot:scaffold3340_cov1256-Pavlova_lutheri.AAC.1